MGLAHSPMSWLISLTPIAAKSSPGTVLAPLWPHTSGAYLYTDPATHGGIWETDSLLELSLSEDQCTCEGPIESIVGLSWGSFRTDLIGNLSADPDFAGAWVHALCSLAYPAFFAAAPLDPKTGLLAPQSGRCSAGLVAIAAVCAQSVAVSVGPSVGVGGWGWTERPVREEGSGLEDVLGAVPLAECLRLCEARADCASVAHGPYGCHLKDRCVSPSDALAPLGTAPGYRTYFRTESDACPAPAASSRASRLGEVQVFMDTAMQLLERAAHCLDASDWPFTVAEVMSNRVSFLEAGLRDRHSGEAATFRWSRDLAQALLPPNEMRLPEMSSGAVRRVLDRLSIRWVRSLDSEVGFWHALLDPASKDSPDVDAAAWESARHWLTTGNVSWQYGEVCKFVAEARAVSGGRFGPPRILNAGSGPLAAGPLECDRERIPVVSADGLARFYMQLHDILGHRPPATPVQCAAEALHGCFPRNHFDVVHVRNALDHAGDPLLGLRRMLEVVRPGGWVLLRHARNEGVPGHFQLGLHQWAFDVLRAADGGSRFAVWNPALRADASAWLLREGLVAEVRAELRPHPGVPDRSGEGGRYAWVDMQKPFS